MRFSERIESLENEIKELNKHAEESESNYKAYSKAVKIVVNGLRSKQKTKEDFHTMKNLVKEKLANEIESFRFSCMIIQKFSKESEKEITKEIDHLEKNYRILFKKFDAFSNDLKNTIIAKEVTGLLRETNVHAIVIHKMIKLCKWCIKDTLDKIRTSEVK